MNHQTQFLLKTKLHQPPIQKGLIARPRLIEQFDRGIHRPLTLVIASAGFGKTTLVSSWLEQKAAGLLGTDASFPAAWLSLDENDSNPNIFIAYFIAALRSIFADACEATLMLLQSSQRPPLAVLYATLSNEIEQVSDNFVLVLDDYQTIRGTEVHDLLNEWALHWPKPLHLVLISRINPPIPLAGLLAKGMISEIRTQDLRFTSEETVAYLDQSEIPPLSKPNLEFLGERFEGWIAGLHLAALSLRSAGSHEAVLSVLSGGNANITGYLMDEVLPRQLPAIRIFLLKTSILDRFTASLCEAVIGETDPAWDVRACLDWIERAELFLTPLDNRRKWFRYHHLFQDLLQQRLSVEVGPDQVSDLHRLASTWFEKHGSLDEALDHALAANDLDLAARQMSAGLCDVLNCEERPTLERWLRLLPEELIQRHPGLLMIRVWTLQFSWRLELQAKVLQRIEKLLDSEEGAMLPANDLQILRGQILLIKSQQAFLSNRTTLAIDLCQQALVFLPPLWTYVRGGVMFYLGFSMQASGQGLEAQQLLADHYESYGVKNDTYAMFLLRTLCFNHLNRGQFEQARQIAQVLLQSTSHKGVAINQNWGDWFLGVVYYHRNELENAAHHFTQIIENRYIAQYIIYRDAVAGLALIHQIKGEWAEARQMLELICQFDLEMRGSEAESTHSLRSRLLLAQGDVEGAGRRIGAFSDPPPDRPLVWLEEPQVTRARLLVARGTEADLQLALQILEVLDEITERTHNTRYKIEILALRAVALDAVAQRAQGETVGASAALAASAALKQAIDLARVGGFVRVFVDLGKPMQEMLFRLAGQGYSVETIHHVLAAFPEGLKNFLSGEGRGQPSRHQSLSISTLIEPLTPRELDVLILLREPLDNYEIARKLNISYATTKRHIINVYGKFGVHRRWDAVTRAVELGILPLD